VFGARSVHAPTDRVDPVNASRSRKLCRLSPRPPSIQTSLTHHLHSHQNSIHPYCTVHDPHTTRHIHRIQRPAHHGPHRTAHRMRLLGSRMAQLSTLSLKGLPRSSLSPPHSKSDYPQTIEKYTLGQSKSAGPATCNRGPGKAEAHAGNNLDLEVVHRQKSSHLHV
jgi:hypothetical protein